MVGDTLDFSLAQGNTEQKNQFNASLIHGLKERGYVKVQHPSVSPQTIHEIFSRSREFFELPLQKKLNIKHPPTAIPNRGYTCVGQENLGNEDESGGKTGVVKNISDLKEALDFGSPADHFMENMWLDEAEAPGFRACVEDFFHRCRVVQMDILRALSEALGVPESSLTEMHSRAENELRMLHYPAVNAAQSPNQRKLTRIAPHTDWGTITMLWQDGCGGLAVEDYSRPGSFCPVDSAPTEFILSIGDSLQRLTNDTLRSTPHQVNFPPAMDVNGEDILPERYSVAYFIKPNRDASLLPLKKFVTEQRPCHYENITAWDYNHKQLARVYY